MGFSIHNLFCVMPKDDIEYCFKLPEYLYETESEAAKYCTNNEKVVTVAEAFEKIASDIHHDA